MAALNSVAGSLGLDRERWNRTRPESIWLGGAVAGGAWALLALNRFGGVVVEAPRSFARLALVGVWGWLGLAAGMWALGRVLGGRRIEALTTAAAVGLAHTTLMALGVVLFVAAGLLELLGPGTVMSWFTLAVWFPAALVGIGRAVLHLDWPRAILAAGAPYLAWYATVGRHLLEQVGHLL